MTDAAGPRKPTIASARRRLRYQFDSSLDKGTGALIRWLAVLSLILISIAALAISVFGIASVGVVEAGWLALLRTLDPGTMGGDVGWGFRLVMLSVTIGGIFLVSSLISVLTTGMESRMAELRKGRSLVLEHGHTLVVGWSEKVFTLLAELAIANENVRRPRIVVLAQRDKVEMEDEIRSRLGDRLGTTKVICRSGDPVVVEELSIANPVEAKSVVILAPDDGPADPFVLKALLALMKGPTRPATQHIVTTVSDRKTMSAALTIASNDVRLINVDDLIARVTAQTCRQSGLSLVYRELLDFDGDEIYFAARPELAGTEFGAALLAFEDSSLIGLRRAGGEILVNPSMNLVIEAGDEVIAISSDDDTVVVAPHPVAAPDETAIVEAATRPATPERTLVLGWNDRGPQIVRRLDDYVPDGSCVDIVTSPALRLQWESLGDSLASIAVGWHDGDPSDREFLESLELASYDHVILLADVGSDADDADTQTLISLLHLRDLARIDGHTYTVVTEILDTRNRQLAQGDHADDFIVSNELVSLMLAQVSEHAALHEVLSGLFDAEGSEIYLRPAGDYVRLGAPVTMATVVESARRRGQTAIGFRDADLASAASRNYGLVLNPPKSTSRTWSPNDRVIVLSVD